MNDMKTLDALEGILMNGNEVVFENRRNGEFVLVNEVQYLKRHKAFFVTIKASTDKKTMQGVRIRSDEFVHQYRVTAEKVQEQYKTILNGLKGVEQTLGFEHRRPREFVEGLLNGVESEGFKAEPEPQPKARKDEQYLVTLQGEARSIIVDDLEAAHEWAAKIVQQNPEGVVLITKAIAMYAVEH